MSAGSGILTGALSAPRAIAWATSKSITASLSLASARTTGGGGVGLTAGTAATAATSAVLAGLADVTGTAAISGVFGVLGATAATSGTAGSVIDVPITRPQAL